MKHIQTFESFLNEFGPLAGSGNARANDLDDKKRDAAKKSERGEMVYVVGGKHGTYKLSQNFETGNTYAAFYNGMPHVVESLNESVNSMTIDDYTILTDPKAENGYRYFFNLNKQ